MGNTSSALVPRRAIAPTWSRPALAPRVAGAETPGPGAWALCPICTYAFPHVNEMSCCGQGLCTECLVRIRGAARGKKGRGKRRRGKKGRCPFCMDEKCASGGWTLVGEEEGERAVREEGEREMARIRVE